MSDLWVLADAGKEWEIERRATPADILAAYRDLLANGQRVEPDYEAAAKFVEDALDEPLFEMGVAMEPAAFARCVVDAAIGNKLLIDPPTEECDRRMSDLKRLDEALKQWTDYRVKRDLVPILDPVETEALLTAFTAARAYRDLLANGQREPDYEVAAKFHYDPDDEGWWNRLSDRGREIRIEEAKRIVDAAIGDKLLIDPTTEEVTGE